MQSFSNPEKHDEQIENSKTITPCHQTEGDEESGSSQFQWRHGSHLYLWAVGFRDVACDPGKRTCSASFVQAGFALT